MIWDQERIYPFGKICSNSCYRWDELHIGLQFGSFLKLIKEQECEQAGASEENSEAIFIIESPDDVTGTDSFSSMDNIDKILATEEVFPT